ncbi:MAG: FitA-like ribbon-helix-helix domain-containing protein [Allosphingosinicella sp.]
MATLTIRRLDDQVYEALRERARSNGRSLEAEVREILAEEARTADALVEELIGFHEEMIRRHGVLPDSTTLLREMRDSE